MNETLIYQNKILDYNYKYYLVESSCSVNDNTKEILKYGIKIEKCNIADEIVDFKCMPNIFESREKMLKAIRILNKLKVTPITLEDIVIDNVYTR